MNSTHWDRSSFRVVGLVLGLSLALAGAALAGKGGGKGGGGGSAATTPVRITFADELGALGYRISGDGLGAYVHDADGSGDGVQAYLGSGGATGDIFLRLANAPGRGLWLDFDDCYPDAASCVSPSGPGVDLVSSIAVAPSVVLANGLLGMAAGTSIEAPMDMYYAFDDPAGPGQIYFDRDLKGRNPCRNKSLYVTVTRPSAAEVWTVSADSSVLSCATLPGGALSGQYGMPFSFTVEIVP